MTVLAPRGRDGIDAHVALSMPREGLQRHAPIGRRAVATDTDLDDELRLLDLNVRSTVHLAKHVLRDMVTRDEGASSVGTDDKDDPADLARDGFEALMAGNDRVVSASLKTKLQGRAGRVLPYSVKAGMHRKMAEPGSGKD
jgi:hypothetical protein